MGHLSYGEEKLGWHAAPPLMDVNVLSLGFQRLGGCGFGNQGRRIVRYRLWD